MATEQVNRHALGDGARQTLMVFRIYDPSARNEPLVINMPWDGSIISVGWQVDVGSYDFTIEIDSVEVTWTTATDADLSASSSPAEDTLLALGAFSAGDPLSITVGTVTGSPAYMQLEILVQINEVDA